MKLALLLSSVVFSVGAFLTLDWFHSASVLRRSTATGTCHAPVPVRHHGFAPYCTSVEHWGWDSYELVTNSLGFRDEKIRAVPLADTRPRILMLGDSFTEGEIAWRDSFVGQIADHFPQYDFLNGGVGSYSPSNYLNTARMVLGQGVKIDEVIVFIDISDVQDEAANYSDIDASGAVTVVEQQLYLYPWYWKVIRIGRHFLLTSYLFEFFERRLVGLGIYHVTTPVTQPVNLFDWERSAWTYRKVNETDPFPAGYAPLGVEGGITKEKTKMSLLWQELAKRNIPISVVVYPYPAQLLHDTVDSEQVRIWREWCEGKCKRFISVFPDFFAAKAQCPRIQPGCWYLKLFVFGDFHYNAAGNALVADAVIQSLADEPPTKHPLPLPALSATPQREPERSKK